MSCTMIASAAAISARSIPRRAGSLAIRGRARMASSSVARAAGIHTAGYTPPAGKVTHTSSATTPPAMAW